MIKKVLYITVDGRKFDNESDARHHERCIGIHDRYHKLNEDSVVTGNGSALFYLRSYEDWKSIVLYWEDSDYSVVIWSPKNFPAVIEVSVSHQEKRVTLEFPYSIDSAQHIIAWCLARAVNVDDFEE